MTRVSFGVSIFPISGLSLLLSLGVTKPEMAMLRGSGKTLQPHCSVLRRSKLGSRGRGWRGRQRFKALPPASGGWKKESAAFRMLEQANLSQQHGSLMERMGDQRSGCVSG